MKQKNEAKRQIFFKAIFALWMVFNLWGSLFGEVKPYAKIWLDLHLVDPFFLVDGDEDRDGASAHLGEFNLERVYLGVKFSYETDIGKMKANATLDVYGERGVEAAEGGVALTTSKSYFKAYLKNAYWSWAIQDGPVDLTLGLQGTQLFKVAEKLWGYRHVAKTFMDHHGFYSSADLGLNVKLKFDKIKAFSGFGETFALNIGGFNGDGYNAIQDESTMNYFINLHYVLRKDLPIVLYGAVHQSLKSTKGNGSADLVRGIYTALLGYGDEGFRAFIEYSHTRHYKYKKDQEASGVSLGMNKSFNKIMSLYLRLDVNLSEGEGEGSAYQSVTKEDGMLTAWLGWAYHPIKELEMVLSYQAKYQPASFIASDSDNYFQHWILLDFSLAF